MSVDRPLVSIFINCKNGVQSVRRPIEGVLNQTYPNVELVFQDGGSTDGTLDIVKNYMQRYPGRIRLNQEPDSCAEEGFFRAFKSCQGDIIGSCCADEELLPDAVAWGVKKLEDLPDAGAIYGDVYVTDLEGNITGTWIAKPFSLNAYICREVDPPFVASFFRRQAILNAGLLTNNWTFGIGEFEFWLRLALKYPIYYTPGLVAKYAFHNGTMSYRDFLDDEKFIAPRKAFFDRFFAEPDLPASISGMKEHAIAGLHLFIGKILYDLGVYPKTQLHIEKALEHIPNGWRLLNLERTLSETGPDWNYERLKNHISAHLSLAPTLRIVCYGAGNDFREFLSSHIFEGHSVVAVVDNYRPKGDLVEGIPVIRESDLGQLEHDMIVITSSKWANAFRNSAMRWSINNPRYVPVI